jgi:hypothetical protein
VETELERLIVRLMGDSSQYQQTLMEAQTATSQVMSHMQEASAGIQGLTGSLEGWGQSALGIVGQLGIALSGLSLAKHAVALANSAENMQIQFGVMVGSGERAKELIADLTKLGAETPYQLQDLLASSKMLLTYGTNVEEILPILKSLGDVTGGDAMKLQRMTYAMSQVQSQGRMTGHVMREMAYAGFNPVQILAEEAAKKTGETVPHAMARLQEHMHKGGLSLNEVKEAFRLATAEGGRFHDNMLKNSQSVTGLFSTMVDNIDMILRDFGGTIVESMHIKDIERALIDLFANAGGWFGSFPPEVKKLGTQLLGLTAIVGGVGLGWTLLGGIVTSVLGNMATLVMAPINGVKALVAGYQALTYALTTTSTAATSTPLVALLASAGPYLLVAAGLAAIAYGLYRVAGGTETMTLLNKELERASELAKAAASEMDYETQALLNTFDSLEGAARRSAVEKALEGVRNEIKGTSQGLEGMNRQIKEATGFWSAMALMFTLGQGSATADMQQQARDQAAQLDKLKERAKLLQEELKKASPAAENEQALRGLDKLNEKFQTQLATMSMTKTEAEIYKATKGQLTEAEKAHTRELADQVEVFTAAHKKQEELKKGTDDLVKSLFEEISTAGMTADQIKLWKLEQLGLGSATEQSMMILMQYAQVANRYKEDLKKGKELMKEVRTPTEVYNDRVKELQKWLQEGAINQTVYNRAMTDAKKKLHDAAAGATHAREELQKLDAVLAGGGEAYARIVEYQERVFGVGRTAEGLRGVDTGGGTVSALEPVVEPIGTVPKGPGTSMLNEQQVQLLKEAVEYLATIAKRPAIQLSGANLR